MDIRTIKNRLDAAAAKVPPPPGKPPVTIFVQKYDPENPPGVDENSWEPDPDRPGQSRHPIPYDGVPTETHWPYKNAAELQSLHERFDRLYGPAARETWDGPCIFLQAISREEIAERDAIRFASEAVVP